MRSKLPKDTYMVIIEEMYHIYKNRIHEIYRWNSEDLDLRR